MKLVGVPAVLKASAARIALTPTRAPELVPHSKAVFASETESPTDRGVIGSRRASTCPAGPSHTHRSPTPCDCRSSMRLGQGAISTSQEIS